jgi:hypothetical protein
MKQKEYERNGGKFNGVTMNGYFVVESLKPTLICLKEL